MVNWSIQKSWTLIVSSFFVLGIMLSPALAGYAHFVVDTNTGKVLAQKNADTLNHPASLTKMMTLYMVFEALRDGRLKWNQKIKMSKNGAATIPFKLGIPAGKTFTVKEAVYGMIVRSSNDAAEGIGDHLFGSERKFGKAMTRKARQLGMRKTVFRNGSGLPDKRQVTTAREMAILGYALMRDFPKEYKLFSMESFKFRGRQIRGHNHLMYRYKGMDGIKTGYINASGFNIVTAVNHRGKRVVGVVMGGKSAKGRDARMASLLDKAMPKASSRRRNNLLAWGSENQFAQLPSTNIPLPRSRPVNTALAHTHVPKTKHIIPQGSATDDEIADLVTKSINRRGSNLEGDWDIQIAATNTRSEAENLLSKAQRETLKQSEIWSYTQPIRVGSDTLYRARFTGFGSRSAARSACTRFKKNGYACFVLSQNG